MIRTVQSVPAIATGTPESSVGAGLLIGVYALQGDFMEHEAMLRTLGADTRQIRKPQQLAGIDGIVIPGGESTTIDKLSRIFGLAEPLHQLLQQGLPALATCAGLIYLASHVEDEAPGQQTLACLDVTVRRNAFGSQLDSFIMSLDVDGVGEGVPAAFIRGPVVTEVGEKARTIARLADGRAVGVQQGDIVALAFHPEQTDDTRLMAWWLSLVRAHSQQ
ncbi:MAG: pyridoxal 5'-phosphate synthase glutaminase subunit PdxT [Actinomycetaceae bacterium]|nr:pyridoxal 5'-phosphate synthase glutaminase subunit PdxT [Arcanobacterium sp.]MDD7687312.1 pyridoxal 5'-phosphate synthase glutaminase subunit PdxT [Actinomycetaceae bacterium]MDY5274081.1 pyridoxal 5'-phosphate synthase glutaminase subunit PdxT [Arcanobacterium sp.]